MTEKAFGIRLMEGLKKKFPEYSIEMKEVTKINDNVLHGIMIKRTDSQAAPVVYQEDAYNRHLMGVSVEDIVDDIHTMLEFSDAPVQEAEDIDPLAETLCVRLLDPRINQRYLRDTPYVTLGSGLAIICDIVRDDGSGGEYRVTINNGTLSRVRCSKMKLFDKALHDMESHQHPVLMDMATSLGLSGDNLIDNESADPNTIYILSNKSRILGASQIVLDSVRRRIATLIGGGYYVIPSSLHEVLIVPEAFGLPKETLERMLVDTNEQILRQEEILSDSLLYVNDTDYTLCIA